MAEQVVLLKDLLGIINGIAAFELAASWDNVGLLVGEPNRKVTGVLVALDPTEAVLDEALELGINTVVTHHPCIFHPIKSVRTDQAVGRFLSHAIVNSLSVVACHTNFDVVAGGVSDVLAARLGLTDVQPMESPAPAGRGGGFGRIGCFTESLRSEDVLNRILDILDGQAVWVSGSLPERIKRMAVCGGSGSELAETARTLGADLYLTSEVKHSTARWAESEGFCIIDAGHYLTESIAVPELVELLRREIALWDIPLKIVAASKQRNPFRLFVRKA